MTLQTIGSAVHRVMAALTRRPETGLHADTSAVARWAGGIRFITRNEAGIEVETDMPTALGGTGDRVTPGWLLRAGVASCAATSITLVAARDGIALSSLEVHVGSNSDTRGLLGLCDADGAPVHAGPFDVSLRVTIAASGIAPAALQTLVEDCLRHSPMPCALRTATPLTVDVHVTSA
jgi:uncharacterized OsmC-like protein